VPAGFVETAELPLTIDPVIGNVETVSTSTTIEFRADVCFDLTSNRYLYVWERLFSATDSDVYAREYDAATNLPAGALFVFDITTDSWQRPAVANNNLHDRNLVVAQRSQNSSLPFTIQGRAHDAGTTVVGAAFTIADPGLPGAFAGDKFNPDVGGDPLEAGPTYFTVVWERIFSPTDHDVHMRQVTADSLTPQLRGTGATSIDNSGGFESNPAISNSNGSGPAYSQRWVIAYQRTFNSSDEDVRAALVSWDGVVETANFGFDGSPQSDEFPSPSSITMGGAASARHFLIAYERYYGPGAGDIQGKVASADGTIRTSSSFLTSLEPELVGQPHHAWDQGMPRVDCDGRQFAVAYEENWSNTTGDWDVRVSLYHYDEFDQTVGISESRAWLAGLFTAEREPAICSHYSGGEDSCRYAVVWRDDEGPNPGTIEARRYEGSCPSKDVYGAGCGPTYPLALDSTLATIGGTWALTTFNIEPVSPIAITFFGDRGPGVPLVVIGLNAPGCDVHLASVVGSLTGSNTGGSATVTVPMALDPSLAGATLSAQSLCLTLANPAGVLVSNGVEITL
jgi:hypothetical protein